MTAHRRRTRMMPCAALLVAPVATPRGEFGDARGITVQKPRVDMRPQVGLDRGCLGGVGAMDLLGPVRGTMSCSLACAGPPRAFRDQLPSNMACSAALLAR